MWGGSSNDQSNRVAETSFTRSSQDSQEEDVSGTQKTRRHSIHVPTHASHSHDGIWLIDDEGAPIRRRGQTTCADIQNLPPNMKVHIEVNELNVPCNMPESMLLGSYIGVIVRDFVLTPISFKNWRNKGMEPFKKKMLDKVEAVHDRLRLWKISRIHHDGFWSSEDDKLKQACEILSQEGLTPVDGNAEANERIFRIVMGPEHLGRVRTQGFGVTPT